MHNINVITDFSAPELDIYARLSEGQLLHYYEPDRGIFIAESPKVIGRALDAGYEPVSFLLETRHIEGEARELLARCRDIPVYTAEFDVLTKLTGFQLTRGVLCAMRRRCLPDSSPDSGSGKCNESHQCGSNFPVSRRFGDGWGIADAGMQRSPVPPGLQGQHGNGISGSLDFFCRESGKKFR